MVHILIWDKTKSQINEYSVSTLPHPAKNQLKDIMSIAGSRSMFGKNRRLVADELVEFDRNNRLKFKTSEILPIILEESIEYSSNE